MSEKQIPLREVAEHLKEVVEHLVPIPTQVLIAFEINWIKIAAARDTVTRLSTMNKDSFDELINARALQDTVPDEPVDD